MPVARLALALLVILLVSACGGTRAAVPGDSRTLLRSVLPNGVPVIIEKNRSADVAAVQLWIKTGGRDEAAGELGLSHYLEHMLCKGTTTRPPGFVERDVESVGGRINAATSWDCTFYRVVLPAGRARDAIEMLADIAQNATLDGGLLEAEKQVVLEEMRLSEDRPRVFLARRLYELVFPQPGSRAVRPPGPGATAAMIAILLAILLLAATPAGAEGPAVSRHVLDNGLARAAAGVLDRATVVVVRPPASAGR